MFLKKIWFIGIKQTKKIILNDYIFILYYYTYFPNKWESILLQLVTIMLNIFLNWIFLINETLR